MKKLLLPLSLVLMLISGASFAACGYTDKFHLLNSFITPPDLTIVGQVTASAPTSAYKTGPASFAIHDTQTYPQACHLDTHNTATVTYGTLTGRCTLTIVDSPIWDNPDITADCSGKLHYVAIMYDGFLSYSYSLAFIER